MDLSSTPLNNSLQSTFALEQTKVMSLTHKLKNHENKAELMKTARQFEGVFIKQLLAAMDSTIDRSGFMGGGSAEEMFRGQLYDHIANNISTRPGGSGFGIAETIYSQLEKQLPKTAQAEPDPVTEKTKRDEP